LTIPAVRVTIPPGKTAKACPKQYQHRPSETRGNPSSARRSTIVPPETQAEVTRLLEEVVAGNENAKNQLFEAVYKDLHKRAHARMNCERHDHSWGTTDLVHEVYYHLMKCDRVFTKNSAYFYGAAYRAMHELLREHARKRKRRPEGHLDPEGPVLLDEVVLAVESIFKVDLIDLMNALDNLKATGKHGERRHDVVRLRLWGGLTYKEIAEDLGVCVATVEKDWQSARAWLYGQLKGEGKR
jgi:RNA polymerase sigma factor (TIGR02999 family)